MFGVALRGKHDVEQVQLDAQSNLSFARDVCKSKAMHAVEAQQFVRTLVW